MQVLETSLLKDHLGMTFMCSSGSSQTKLGLAVVYESSVAVLFVASGDSGPWYTLPMELPFLAHAGMDGHFLAVLLRWQQRVTEPYYSQKMHSTPLTTAFDIADGLAQELATAQR